MRIRIWTITRVLDKVIVSIFFNYNTRIFSRTEYRIDTLAYMLHEVENFVDMKLALEYDRQGASSWSHIINRLKRIEYENNISR